MQKTEGQITEDIWIRDAVVTSDGTEVCGFIGARYQKVEEKGQSKGKNGKVSKDETEKISYNLILFVENESSRYFIDRMSPSQKQSPTLDLQITGLDKSKKQRTITGKFRIGKMEGINPATVELHGKGVIID